MRKIIIAPDSFKGTMSARKVAETIARAVKDVSPDYEPICIPIADGGEGTVDAFGAGIGIAMAGYSILFTAVSVGVLKFLLVSTGLLMGTYFIKSERWQYFASVLTGLILLALGFIELMK